MAPRVDRGVTGARYWSISVIREGARLLKCKTPALVAEAAGVLQRKVMIMEFTTEDQLSAKIAEMLEAHRGKVDIDLHIDSRFERLCSVVAGVIDSLKVADLPTEDGGQYLLQHRHEPPATWLMNASHYRTPEGVEAHGGYSLLSVTVRKLGRKECQLRLILQDDTPSVVNYFTRLTYSIWKMFHCFF